ncbi:hypothetical protein G6011_03684 [Alternaria panax]|uniref:Integral membrane protein n=1 Tax=Alternaria panax TaxID=48097 RepID=A0AAD4IFP2_9PLEO|nr:hypothetical protein G6011_03684 [Alternaria panax]
MSDPNATLIECRVEYALGSAIIAARFFTRWKALGWRSFYWDDFFAFWSWIFFTLIYVMVEYLIESTLAVSSALDCLTDTTLGMMGAPIAMSQEQREALPPAMRKLMREGAKGMFASFYFLIFSAWSLKGSLIFLFLRLTRSTRLYHYVQAVGAIPIAGDALLLVVPSWMLRDAKISLWRKTRVIFLLSLDLFIMGMAIARYIVSIGTSVQILSVFAVNAPIINSLFRAETWATRHSSGDYVSKDCHRSRTNTSTLGKKTNGFEIYKMTDIETKMTGFETSSKESTTDLFKDPILSPVPSKWRCSLRGASQDGHLGRMASRNPTPYLLSLGDTVSHTDQITQCGTDHTVSTGVNLPSFPKKYNYVGPVDLAKLENYGGIRWSMWGG